MARTTTPSKRRPAVFVAAGVALVIVIALVFLLSSAGGGGATTKTSQTSTATSVVTCAGTSTSQTITIISGPVLVGASGKVAAGVPCADGHLGTRLYYTTGQPISIQVTVPDSLTPVSIQTVYDGNPDGTSPWDVKSTGHTFVLGFGNANESPLTLTGIHDIYAILTFSDNTTATSNVVYIGVNVPPPSQ